MAVIAEVCCLLLLVWLVFSCDVLRTGVALFFYRCLTLLRVLDSVVCWCVCCCLLLLIDVVWVLFVCLLSVVAWLHVVDA